MKFLINAIKESILAKISEVSILFFKELTCFCAELFTICKCVKRQY